jgi:hypothetical protein
MGAIARAIDVALIPAARARLATGANRAERRSAIFRALFGISRST